MRKEGHRNGFSGGVKHWDKCKLRTALEWVVFMVLSRVRLIRVRLVLVNLNPINDTYSHHRVQKFAITTITDGKPQLRSGQSIFTLSIFCRSLSGTAGPLRHRK